MRKYLTLIIKISIFIITLSILALSIYGIVVYIDNWPFNSDYAYILYPVLIGMLLSTIPMYIISYKSYLLLKSIDDNLFFSLNSVKNLNIITICKLIITGLFIIILPFVYLLADKDDAPGFIIINIGFIFVFFVLAVFSKLLNKLIQENIDLKS